MTKKTAKAKFRPEFKGDHVFEYKDPVALMRFVSEGGKISPARLSKLSLNQQKNVAKAIKKARNLGMLPVGSIAYDNYGFPEPISPKPFQI